MRDEPTHTPVMSERVVALLAPALATPGAILVDATLGLGGHSRAQRRLAKWPPKACQGESEERGEAR